MKTNQDGKPSTVGRQVDRPLASGRVSVHAATGLVLALTALSTLLLVLAVVLLVLNWDLGVRALTPHLVLGGAHACEVPMARWPRS